MMGMNEQDFRDVYGTSDYFVEVRNSQLVERDFRNRAGGFGVGVLVTAGILFLLYFV